MQNNQLITTEIIIKYKPECTPGLFKQNPSSVNSTEI